MSDFCSERRVKKTKKEHRCFGCRAKLPINSTCFYIVGVYEGYFGTHYLCSMCRKYLNDNPEVAREGYDEGDIRDWMKEDEEWKKQRVKML